MILRFLIWLAHDWLMILWCSWLSRFSDAHALPMVLCSFFSDSHGLLMVLMVLRWQWFDHACLNHKLLIVTDSHDKRCRVFQSWIWFCWLWNWFRLLPISELDIYWGSGQSRKIFIRSTLVILNIHMNIHFWFWISLWLSWVFTWIFIFYSEYLYLKENILAYFWISRTPLSRGPDPSLPCSRPDCFAMLPISHLSWILVCAFSSG